MALHMPALTTERLTIRPLVMDDLDAIYRILDVELADAHTGAEHAESKADRERWLRWTVLGYEELARLYQLPLGDRAIVLRESGELIGAVGYNPAAMPFGQVPGLGAAPAGRAMVELGMFWAVSPQQQGRGYAAEAGRAMVEYALGPLGLWRVVAVTEHANIASQRVMEKIGMTLYQNPLPEPAYFQVVGVREG